MNQQTFIPSPCIRKCGLDEREICRGCFRSIEEIIGWEAMNSDQRQQTLDNCQRRRELRTRRG
ncbi:DUF1289 domain-containing protein [uncultured Methylophaga sp.]|jgi:hypothetical protein|uniref:DUF1289 domain-containing protein n=1 Tax=uncultured Methylophaga sp. TaxID=285271 RepID=UPI002638646E|nr:DUF1289 domain-containing protein [uncultured Methylophaga sp.]